MSIEAINWALSMSAVENPTEAMTLLGLANHANKFGRGAWPSVSTLAEYVRVSDRTIHRTLRELELRGVIRRGNQDAVQNYRGGYRSVVYDIPMGVGAPMRPPVNTDDEVCQSVIAEDGRGDTGVAGGMTPVADEPPREPPFLTSQRGALSSPENPDSVQLVSSDKRPPRKRSGSLRNVVAEEGPDTGRVVGKRGSTERAIRTHEARRTISRPNSGGGLAAEFGQRASEAGISGPQEVNGAALARSLTRWMGDGNNPDTPERIRSMMDAFFEKPGGSEDYPLWRRFLSEAPKLRNTERKSEPYDYAAASEREHERIKRDAARGDIRAQMELSGENRPWLEYVK